VFEIYSFEEKAHIYKSALMPLRVSLRTTEETDFAVSVVRVRMCVCVRACVRASKGSFI